MKKGGIVRNRIRSYNQFLGDEMDKRKSHNDSRGEILDKINGKYILILLIKKIYTNRFLKTSNSDNDSDSTEDSHKPSYIEKFENCNKILANLKINCNTKNIINLYSNQFTKRATKKNSQFI